MRIWSLFTGAFLIFLKKFKGWLSIANSLHFIVQLLTYLYSARGFMKYILAFVFLFITGLLFSQADWVKLKAVVIDNYTRKTLAGVSVINPKLSVTMPTDTKGYFETTVVKSDTLFLFFPGYHTVKFSVADSVFKSEYQLKLLMEPLTTSLSQPVVVKPPKTLEEIEEERRNLGKTPKELERPEVSFTSPISALYEMLSGKAREREKLKQQIKDDERRKVFKALLDYYNENGLIDLPERNYDDFINYCNMPLEFLKYNTDYEITKTVIALYNKYGRETGIIK